jgi:hypothetical protein
MSARFVRTHVAALAAVALPLACSPATPETRPAPQGGGNAPAAQGPSGGPTAGGQQGGGQAGGAQARRGPRPYAQVVTSRAVTDTGGITVHQVDDRWLFEVPDSLVGRDLLLVGRVAAVPANFGGFLSAGTSVQERLVRWEKNGDRLFLRALVPEAVADDSLPIALSVAANHLGPILAAFPVQAYAPGNRAAVIDVTDFFAGDTPAVSGLSAAQRTQYQVRRLDPARSYVSAVRSYPLNVEVRHTQTFDAGRPPSDVSGGSISLEMRQSLVVLPRTPMRPRYADPRAGFFTVERVNYGLDEQKAATQTFITRWRLEPKDPAAYARGELVEPVQPIVYYIDPATPTKWRKYVRQGVEDWQKAFEKAGFRNAIVAKEPPTSAEDPNWDPEDIRHSVVRWAASTTRNAVGPSTVDPRTGEIIESDITWYHNHMRSYRNRLMIETGAANASARSLDIPEELMGETMRKVITHEVGHALGLPHNMIASNAFPVDSLRSASFTRQYGVSGTIMDYARQNYVAQPGDGLQPVDFIRRLGPYDDFIIEWGYRQLPNAPTPEAERPVLNRMLTSQTGPMAYRYLPQYLSGIDPRSQTEDIGNDPVAAGTYAIANLERVVPNLPAWTARAGEDYSDLGELHGETVGMWSRYMGHVVSVIGGVHVDPKSTEQEGAVYRPVSRRQQERALEFLAAQVFATPSWLAPEAITSRIGPTSLANAQAGVVTQLLDPRRLDRVALSAEMEPTTGYPLSAYLADLRRALWPGPTTDEGRRTMQRVYLDRLAAIVTPPAPATGGPGGGQGGGGGTPPSPLVAPLNVQRSDLPALARSELRTVRAQAQAFASRAPAGVQRAHWQDVVARIDLILEPR